MGISDLFKYIADIWKGLKKRAETIRKKDGTINELREALKLKENLTCKGSAYFIEDDKGEFIDGPFCTKCFDVDRIKCRIAAYGKYTNVVQCLKCKVPFESAPASEYLHKQNSSK